MSGKKLTVEQALAKLAKDPEHCPYCGGDFEGEGVDIQNNSLAAQQECTCMDCSASFYINYKFDDADFISGPSGPRQGDDDADEEDE